jgi:hypothetical protein
MKRMIPDKNLKSTQVFSGSATVTLSAGGFDAVTQTEAITIIVSGVSMTVSDSSSTASGASYAVPVTVVFSEHGISCLGEVIFTGTISGDTAFGTISGNIPCAGFRISISVVVTGTFVTSK